jgi:hypothetical protein
MFPRSRARSFPLQGSLASACRGLVPGQVGEPRRWLRGIGLLLVLIAVLAPAVAEAVFEAPVTFSAAGQDAFDPQVAVDGAGDAVAVWSRFDGTDYRIQARTRSAAGVLGPIQTLSGAGQDAIDPQVAVDGGGLAVWQRSDGTTGCGGAGCSRIQAAAGP